MEPRESLRLMGFPDTFKITVSRAQSYKQSGNSIVVDVLMAIISNINKISTILIKKKKLIFQTSYK